MIYRNAREFGDIIKKEFYEFEQDPEDIDRRIEEIKKQYEKIAAKYNFIFPLPEDFTALKTKFQNVIDLIVNEFYSLLPKQLKEEFEGHFYFGTIDSRDIQAHIRRSSDKSFFGVFINSSLIGLLTKIGKLDAAAVNPNCVIFCNRFPDSKPGLTDILSMRDEMFSYLSTFKWAHGPFLIINELEAATHFSRLAIQEKFIFYHEIAHFLNGDLFESASQQQLIGPFQNIYYQREHLADILAFALVLRSEPKSTNSKKHCLFIIAAIIRLFDIMYGLQNEDREKHPMPLNRMNVVIESYFGVELADLVEKTYFDESAWDSLASQQFEFKFEIANFYKSIDKMFVNAFDKKNW